MSRSARLDKFWRECKKNARNHAPSGTVVGTGKVGDQPERMGADRVRDRKLTLATQTNLAQQDAPKSTRRDFLYVATGAVGAVGVAAAVWPLIDQLNPDASVLALASIEFDLSGIEEGQSVTIQWRGLPVFVRHRTAAEIEEARAVPLNELKDPEPDEARVKEGHEQWLIMIANCTHLGCVPVGESGDFDGWFCPCHGSHYDTAGRIRKGPAPINLVLPPYEFLSDTLVQIG
jgi:ubiquinol-cytochrome c reductase iron-sulfur subunit